MSEEKQLTAEEIEKQQEESEAVLRATDLQPHVGRIVEYYDDGGRIGYLVTIKRVTCDVQPIGTIGTRPRIVTVPIQHVYVCTGPTKYPTLESYASFAGWEKQVFIHVSPTGRLAESSEPNLQNIKVPLSAESAAISAEIKAALTGSASKSAPGAPRQAREEIVNSAEFIALFEQVRARFKDPNKSTCKRGHILCAQNAHVGDLRRPPHRYSCDPCLRKVPAAPGFSE